jgi:hypothetical protein
MVKAMILELLPQSELLDESATNLVFTINT